MEIEELFNYSHSPLRSRVKSIIIGYGVTRSYSWPIRSYLNDIIIFNNLR